MWPQISTRLYLNTRYTRKDGTSALYIVITRKGTPPASLPLDIFLKSNQWDSTNNLVIEHPKAKSLNKQINTLKVSIDIACEELTRSEKIRRLNSKECIPLIKASLDPFYKEQLDEQQKLAELKENSFLSYFRTFIETKHNPGTKQLYTDTYNKILAFCDEGEINTEELVFDDIKKSWLEMFQSFCLKTERQNSASRHLRDIRAVFNAAIDDEKTSNYPFRKFKIKVEESRDKSFSADELRALFNHPCYPGTEQEAVDMFKLMFCLIGINRGDMAHLGKPIRGRVEYTRAKTHKQYSIKIEPEAAEIIKKYAGKDLLLNILEKHKNENTYFRNMIRSLERVGMVRHSGKGTTGNALVPDICTGSARTSWATIAQEDLQIPRETIAAALGHHTVDVTSTYLRTEWKKKVDEANRKVLDWVFYTKR